MQFEWDEAKAAGNWKKHGVTFAEATRVFDDWSGIEVLDDNIAYGEERWVLIGSTGTVEADGGLHDAG